MPSRIIHSLFVLSSCLLITHTAFSQKSLGARLGMTLSSFSNPDLIGLENSRAKWDYTGGYLVEIEMNTQKGARESNLTFQTGMIFERRGMLSNGFDEKLGKHTKSDMTLKYFSFPVVLKGAVDDNDILNFMFGPEISLLYLATNRKEYKSVDFETMEEFDASSLTGVTSDFKSMDISITAGVSVDIPVGKRFRVPLDVRIGKSLMDTRRNPSRFEDSTTLLMYKFNTGLVLYY